jgi:hypothetical protein
MLEATMRRRNRIDRWTDVLIVGVSLLVIGVSLATAYVHWREAHRNTAVKRINHPPGNQQ